MLTRLKAQRKEIARWQAFKQVYHDRLSGEYQPLARRLRDRRIDTAKLLDHALERKALKKRERDKVWETLRGLLLTLLEDQEEAELVELHDKYADVSFAEQRRLRMKAMRSAASRDFGVDVDAYAGGESPDELRDWITDQVRAAAAEPEVAAEVQERGGREGGMGAKAAAREEREERVIEGGARSMREVFRKLVSELHPDRETDPAEHARKTDLMQKVNKAYKTGDLFTLLEMQRSRGGPGDAPHAGLPEERFKHYNHVLEAQSQRLREDLSTLMAPFEIVVGDAVSRKITPDDVKRALETDIVDLKGVLRTVELDLAQFQDILQLKPALKNRPFDPSDQRSWDMPDDTRPYRGRRR